MASIILRINTNILFVGFLFILQNSVVFCSDSDEFIEGKEVVVIADSKEDIGPNDPNTEILECNSTTQLEKPGIYYYVESENFGDTEENYPPGQHCTYLIKGVPKTCIPIIYCDKTDLRKLEGELVVITDFEGGGMKLKQGDHFHKAVHSKSLKLEIQFTSNPSTKFKRHHDGFRCTVGCKEESIPPIPAETDTPYITPGSGSESFVPTGAGSGPDSESGSGSVSGVDSSGGSGGGSGSSSGSGSSGSCSEKAIMSNYHRDSETLEFNASSTNNCTIKIPLGCGKPRSFTLIFNINDLPILDLYMLIEMGSVSVDPKHIGRQMPKLIKTMGQIAKDVRFGFGTFCDKNDPDLVKARSLFEVTQGTAIYSFRNNFPLRELDPSNKTVMDGVTEAAKKTMKFLQTTNNTEENEDSLTALHQAVKCSEQIGWRKNAQKMIILATDSGFQTIYAEAAARGYEAFEPGRCYLDDSEGNTFSGDKVNYPRVEDVAPFILQQNVKVLLTLVFNENTTYDWDVFTDKMNQTAVYLQYNVQELTEQALSARAKFLTTTPLRLTLNRAVGAENSEEGEDEGGKEYVKMVNAVGGNVGENGEVSKDFSCTPIIEGAKGQAWIECKVNVELPKCPPKGVKELWAASVEGYGTAANLDFEFLCHGEKENKK